jgi:hypothetical protein
LTNNRAHHLPSPQHLNRKATLLSINVVAERRRGGRIVRVIH